jgi:glycosyltransferase involved in cell wall biosynthesis
VNPRVSVVIPTYNRKALLLESIASVQRQTFADLEILVCDDGSTDGSHDAVQQVSQHDSRVRWLSGAHCGYPGVVRNRGIRAARGEWIGFQDSDDLWLTKKLEKQLALAAAAPEARFIYSHAAALRPDGSRRRMLALRIPRQGRLFEVFLFYSVIVTPTVLVRRDFLLRAGLFDEQMQLTVAEDYELFLRLAAQTPFFFVPEDLALCRLQPDSVTRDLLGGLDQVERVLETTVRRFGVAVDVAGRALSKIDLRRYKQHLLGDYRRDVRLRDLRCALERHPGSRTARALLLAETLGCARVVKAYVRLTEGTAVQAY